MSPRNTRYSYSPIISRADYSWPDGKRLAVYLALNVEQYKFGEGVIEELVPATSQPDVLNYSWCDYGTRVGIWRLLELVNDFRFPVTLLVNSDLYATSPEVVDAFRRRGDEIACHGRTNSERQGGLTKMGQRKLIEESTCVLKKYEGKSPVLLRSLTAWQGGGF
jgi:peptidoglycan/xylan/chitin deacetylase (PgdA/CDA1 family)